MKKINILDQKTDFLSSLVLRESSQAARDFMFKGKEIESIFSLIDIFKKPDNERNEKEKRVMSKFANIENEIIFAILQWVDICVFNYFSPDKEKRNFFMDSLKSKVYETLIRRRLESLDSEKLEYYKNYYSNLNNEAILAYQNVLSVHFLTKNLDFIKGEFLFRFSQWVSDIFIDGEEKNEKNDENRLRVAVYSYSWLGTFINSLNIEKLLEMKKI